MGITGGAILALKDILLGLLISMYYVATIGFAIWWLME